MFFFKFENCFCFVTMISIQNVITLIFYNHCSFHEKMCLIINNYFKYAKYIYRDRFCVFIFLKSFNCIHEKFEHQLNQIEIEHKIQFVVLFCLTARIFCLKKKLKKNKIRIVQKIRCVVLKLDENNNNVNDEFFIEIFLSQFVNDLFV